MVSVAQSAVCPGFQVIKLTLQICWAAGLFHHWQKRAYEILIFTDAIDLCELTPSRADA